MAFVPGSSIDVARTGIESIFSGIVCYRVNVAANYRVFLIAEECACLACPLRTVVSEMRILSKGIRNFHGLPVIGRVVNVHGGSATLDIAVVAPHKHLYAADVPRVDARERVEVPAGIVGVFRCMRKVITVLRILHRNWRVRF